MVRYLIGIDEVGRGPLAGPLCVGAFLVERTRMRQVFTALGGIRDSKQLSPAVREGWLQRIREVAHRGQCRFSTAFVREHTIDRDGLGASLRLAIGRALRKFKVSPEECYILLDGGLHASRRFPFQGTVIKGDEQEPLIATASIVAKVRRDRYMIALASRFPAYGFEQHKGYGTKRHYDALRTHGISPMHRQSFLKKFQIPNTD